MKKMKKILSIIGIVFLLLILAVILAISLYGGKILKIGVEQGASFAMKVHVSLDHATLYPLRGKVSLTELVIQNPSGYQHLEFLKMGGADVSLNTKSIFSDTIEIDQIKLDNIELTIEQKTLTQNNLQEILNNLPKSDSSQPKEKSGSGKQLVIKDLQINGVAVNVKLLPIPGKADTVTLKLAPIQLKDLGTNKPLDMAGLTKEILNAIAGGVAQQGKDILPTEMLSDLGGTLAESGKEILKGAQDIGKQATDALKGLFPGKKE